MTIEGVDFSWGRPGAAALIAAGKKFVVRYITGSGAKALSAAEIKEYRAAGLAIALVFETTAGRALSGYSAGLLDGTAAATRMQALGIPKTVAVYFAVDVNTTSGNYSAIKEYFRGVARSIPKSVLGVYGEYDLVRYLDVQDTVTYLWQTYAWSGGRIYPPAHLYQYLNGQKINGAAVDFCRAQHTDYGQWHAPVPLPDTTTGVDMSYDVPRLPTVVPVKDGAWLYKDAALTDKAWMIEPGPRDMPVHGMTTNYLMVAYVNAAGVNTGIAFFVRKADCGTMKDIPPQIVKEPVTAETCKTFSTSAVLAEKRRVRDRVRDLLEL